jgi:ankyrin repeat protein
LKLPENVIILIPNRIVAMLLSNNANVEANDKDGIRPIDLAISYNNEAAVLQMLKKGAKLGPTTWAAAKGKPRLA